MSQHLFNLNFLGYLYLRIDDFADNELSDFETFRTKSVFRTFCYQCRCHVTTPFK